MSLFVAADDGESHFQCPGCDRRVPVSKGCADDMFELCDDCWLHVVTAREQAAAEDQLSC